MDVRVGIPGVTEAIGTTVLVGVTPAEVGKTKMVVGVGEDNGIEGTTDGDITIPNAVIELQTSADIFELETPKL